eukprot:TRINITY_DN3134_c0_g1_i2.p1 TRINITY_DN3134_c0_g1~~TRINITY_DN3134_c0_g1_i2.p1  ORF type:complete len:799 (+),score=86.00 TRINITY_DN3134_c0_g1_i2:360-2399(+)
MNLTPRPRGPLARGPIETSVKIHDSARRSLEQFLLRRPPISVLVKKNYLEGGCFGSPLENLHHYENNIPIFIETLLTFISSSLSVPFLFVEEGDEQNITDLKQAIDDGGGAKISASVLSDYGPLAACSVLKQFFVLLPEPVVPTDALIPMIKTAEIQSSTYQLSAMHSLIHGLAPYHRAVLLRIIRFLSDITKRSGQETPRQPLTAGKLSKIFAPILFRVSAAAFAQSSSQAKVVEGKCRTILEAWVMQSSKLVHGYNKNLVLKCRDGRVFISATSLSMLVAKLVDKNYYTKDTEFTPVVYYTFTYFTTSKDLLKKLAKVYKDNNPNPNIPSKNWQFLIRMRVLRIVTEWIEKYAKHFPKQFRDNRRFMTRLRKFSAGLPRLKGKSSLIPEEQAHFEEIHMFLAKHRRSSESMLTLSAGSAHISSMLRSMSPEVEIRHNFVLFHCDPIQLAEQITLMESGLFLAVPLSEFLQDHLEKETYSPCFHDLSRFSQWLGSWICMQVMQFKRPSKRGRAIEIFTHVANRCLELRNFNSVFTITTTLTGSAIGRLNASMKHVGQKEVQILATLTEFLNPTKNSINYRATLKQTLPPLVPVFGILSRDLYVLEDANKTIVEDSKMINFAKMRMVYKQILPILLYQQIPYKLQKTQVFHLLQKQRQLKTLDSNEQFALSLELEKRKK